jgi:hypothetical protein
MPVSVLKEVSIQDATETLIDFAVDRDDLTLILDSLPPKLGIDRETVEYEIQILKILMVGWSLSFFLEDSTSKVSLINAFWAAVRDFSHQLSVASSAALNKDFDYFLVLKNRLDTYLSVVNRNQDIKDPLAVIGPAFSMVCGQKDNAVVIHAGNKMFHLAVNGVKHYLESVELMP